MDQLIGVITSFPAGVICAMVLVYGLVWFHRIRLQQTDEMTRARLHAEHETQMTLLRKEWNQQLDRYERKQEKLHKRLARMGLFIETDEAGREILVKRIPLPGKKRR